MANNVAATPGTGATFKTTDTGGVHTGHVNVDSLPDVTVEALPARAATADAIVAKHATDAIHNGLTALTPKFAKIAASSSGNNTLVAAVTAKKLRVVCYNFVVAGAVNVKFQSAASGTDLTGLKTFAAAGGGMGAGYNPVGWFETVSGELLNLNLSGAVVVGGELTYIEV